MLDSFEGTPAGGTIDGMNPETGRPYRLAVLTSGGDAPGMNAAVRAVVRTALAAGAQPYAFLDGWDGAIRGGKYIQPMDWASVGSTLDQGGTTIGTARSDEFRSFEGRGRAAENLLNHGIDGLILIGGDGSLTGADEFRDEWAHHVANLVDQGRISAEVAATHPQLTVVGLVASIDNDLVGSDMTIGADSALTRIVDAIDMIASTAASHQRTFVIEVMGRHCGYLPLMSAVAGGADYVFAPEMPPGSDWREEMTRKLALGRQAGRRESIILVAEGARDREGNRITSEDVRATLQERMNEDARVTILGHIQRGGAPSAYDRWMSTLLGYAAVQELLDPKRRGEASILGVRRNRVTRLPLAQAIRDTRAVEDLVEAGDLVAARRARGNSFFTMGGIFQVLSDPPQLRKTAEQPRRVALLHAGGLAPGMNAAARAAVRIGLHKGWTVLGVEGSWAGLEDEEIRELDWHDVEGWAFDGGAELGTRRAIPVKEQLYALGRAVERNRIDALIVIGGYNAYLAVKKITGERAHFPALKIPMVLVPTSIDNNLPGTELSIGADTALNNDVWALDRMKESAAASRRCFVAEAMGRRCGYLAMMSGMATGAEFIYLNEEPLTLSGLSQDIATMRQAFEDGRRLFLVVMNEETSTHYDREFIARAVEAAGEGLFDVRSSALGYIQQGGRPTPFDRLLAARFANAAVRHLVDALDEGDQRAVYLGMTGRGIEARSILLMDDEVDPQARRPLHQWWLPLRTVAQVVSLEHCALAPQKIQIRDAEPVSEEIQDEMNTAAAVREKQ